MSSGLTVCFKNAPYLELMDEQYTTATSALKVITSGMRVFIHSVAAAPQLLIKALTERAPELRNVEIVHMHTEGEAPYVEPGMEASFRVNALFVGANVRRAVQEGRADYVPVFLSDAPSLFRNNILPLDVALITVSPPDRHGYCSLGVSVDITPAAIQSAKIVIAQVNKFMPRTHGDGAVHVSRIDHLVTGDEPLPESHMKPLTETDLKIGTNVAELVEDGATLQMGIGSIPNAVLAALASHRQLGVHTEMFSDGLIDLVEKGIITNEHKRTHPGRIVSGFAYGTRRLYDFVDDNPHVSFLDIAYVNDTSVIRKNPKVTAINSAIEVDLTGQVCADSIGTRQYSGVGGQMDFIRERRFPPGANPLSPCPA